MRQIILGFSVPIKPTIFAKSIMWVDGTPYDHVYVKWNWATINRDIIYQASKLAVNFESNLTFDSHAISLEEYELQISDLCHQEIMQFCMDNSDKPYGVKQILGFAVVKLFKLFGKKISNPFPSYGSTFVCSKIAAEIIAKAGVKIDMSFDDIDPLDLHNIVIESNLTRIK